MDGVPYVETRRLNNQVQVILHDGVVSVVKRCCQRECCQGEKEMYRILRDANVSGVVPTREVVVDGKSGLLMPAWRGLSGYRGESDHLLLDKARSCAVSLAYVHLAGILHNNVKPGNILVDPNERPVLCDFDMATHSDATYEVCGTPLFRFDDDVTPSPRRDLRSLCLTFDWLSELWPSLCQRPTWSTLSQRPITKTIWAAYHQTIDEADANRSSRSHKRGRKRSRSERNTRGSSKRTRSGACY